MESTPDTVNEAQNLGLDSAAVYSDEWTKQAIK